MRGLKEETLYVPCIPTDASSNYVATIDVDEKSARYCEVIGRLYLPTEKEKDEIHHSGWNTCSSCHDDAGKERRYLVFPSLSKNGSIFVVDTKNPKNPTLHKVLSGSEIKATHGVSYPHTLHCLRDGKMMLSYMGDEKSDEQCQFLLLDEDFKVSGSWLPDSAAKRPRFGYDFWYQPYHNVMVSSEWGSPKAFSEGFKLSDLSSGLYGHSIHVWDWTKRVLLKTIDLGEEGRIPLELRFAHDPKKAYGFVGCALSSNIFLFYKDDSGEWQAKKVIEVNPRGVEGWILPSMPGLITDILLSMDDHYLYFSNWLHGDIRQYDISNPHQPRLMGQIFVGGLLRPGGPLLLTDGSGWPELASVKGRTSSGGPQMIQLSLDGKRLYVTDSLFSSWDRQFYPKLVQTGSVLLRVDVNIDKGGLKLNEGFLVDFGDEPKGPALAHEIRYPGGDCSSDVFLCNEAKTKPQDYNHPHLHEQEDKKASETNKTKTRELSDGQVLHKYENSWNKTAKALGGLAAVGCAISVALWYWRRKK